MVNGRRNIIRKERDTFRAKLRKLNIDREAKMTVENRRIKKRLRANQLAINNFLIRVIVQDN